MESIPELTKASDSPEESKAEGSKFNVQRYRRPRIIYSRKNLSELPNIADRKYSKDKGKRLQDLNERIRLKNIPQKFYINIGDRRPPRPIVLSNRYQVGSLIKQAGLAVIESPHYAPIRASKS